MAHRANQTSFKKGHKMLPGSEKGWFGNGRKAWNKGTKGLTKRNKTTFEKGQVAWNKGRPRTWNSSGDFKKGQNTMERHPNWRGGKSFPDYKEKLAGRPKPSQCEVCEAFETSKNIHFDHNHETGKFRGWLCIRCNMAIGLVKDVPEVLERLAEYLRKNN